MKQYITYILLLIMIISCNKKITNQNYNESLLYFQNKNKKLVSHFPIKKNLLSKYSVSVDTSAYFNTESLNITITNAKEEIERIKKENKYNLYKITDPCIVAVNDFIKEDNFPFIDDDPQNNNYHTTYSENCRNKNYKIIPNFWGAIYGKDSKIKNNLSSNFKYIILDSNTEIIYSDKIRQDISYMPAFINHGYSKGIAFNEDENIIIYWVVLW